MEEVYIVDACRTAIGSFNGSLSNLQSYKMGEILIRSLIQRNNIETSAVSQVIIGQVLVAGQGQNPARQASINAGISHHTPAWMVSQVCGSGLKSVILGTQSIMVNESDIVLGGGQESMSLAMHAANIRSGAKSHVTFKDTMITDGLWDAFGDYHMGITAENIAKKYDISRESQDEFAFNSQLKASKALSENVFSDEIIPVTVKNRKSDIIFDRDEFPRTDTTIESLSKLKPAFDKDGTVTAGNASGLNDGAAMLLLMSESTLKKYNLTPLARVVSFANAGVEAKIMGIGPVESTKIALKKAGWNISDLDIIESNEAFASQSIAVNKLLEWDVNKVNVNGGAIALGHPIGASGARILVTLLHAMRKRNLKKGLATLCVGGGMGVSLCVEKC